MYRLSGIAYLDRQSNRYCGRTCATHTIYKHQRMRLLFATMMLARIATAFRSSPSAVSRRAFSISSPSVTTFTTKHIISSNQRTFGLPTSRYMSSETTIEETSTNSDTQQTGYPFAQIETKWQKYWKDNNTFATPNRRQTLDDGTVIKSTNKKKYVLDMFPYPSGAGLHVGHPEGYTASDVMSRYWRMTSHDVLHPIGWDSFGLPAEQFAINTGTHPETTTAKNIANFKRQLQMLGFSYDWEKEVATTDVNYVKWTQWIFLQLFKKGLASQSSVSVNWCPALGTVLANEEVINGLSERGDHPVERLPLRQWVLKITEYADRLEAGLDGLDWPSGTMTAQEQWIGKSTGTEIDFKIDGMDDEVRHIFFMKYRWLRYYNVARSLSLTFIPNLYIITEVVSIYNSCRYTLWSDLCYTCSGTSFSFIDYYI